MKCSPCILLWGLFFLILGEGQADSNEVPGTDEVTIEEFPYVVQLYDKDNYICPGALIRAPDCNVQAVLTTAECVTLPDSESLRDISSLKAVAGVNEINLKDPFPESYQERNVEAIVRHPEWKRDTKNDIALVFLEIPLDHNQQTLPVGLPPEQDIYPDSNSTMHIIGWRFMKEKESVFAKTLKKFELPVVSIENCREVFEAKYGKDLLSSDSSLCGLKSEDEAKSAACITDSGAPATKVDTETRSFYLVGLYGWTPYKDYGFCNDKIPPHVLTRVSHYLPWIRENCVPPPGPDENS